MKKAEGLNLIDQVKSLAAENASLKAKLLEQQNFSALKEKEIQELKLKIAAGSEAKSNHDNLLLEMEILQNYLDDMQRKSAGAQNREMEFRQQINKDISAHHQLEDLQQQYNYLKARFTDLQQQLEEANKRIFLLQNQNINLAEQQVLLADAIQERDEWKALAKQKK